MSNRSTSNKFGWCATGHHDLCRVAFFSVFDQKDHACKCDCHKENEMEEEEIDKEVLAQDIDDMLYTRMKEE